MVDLRTCTAAALLALAIAAPAAAQWSTLGTAAPAAAVQPAAAEAKHSKPVPSTAIPEPANIALFAAGVIGLLLGRRGSRSRHDGD
ncbi:MAG: hypothetical protein JWL91_2224 [Sphingomonas bacterium]|nr:hypothetical protein [Sphingomonas bacterium]